jgi:hypothetical protein
MVAQRCDTVAHQKEANKYEHSQKALFHLSSPAAHACLSRSTYVTSPLARSERKKESKANGIKPFFLQ